MDAFTEDNSKIICKYENPGEMSHFYLLKIFSEIDKIIIWII